MSGQQYFKDQYFELNLSLWDLTINSENVFPRDINCAEFYHFRQRGQKITIIVVFYAKIFIHLKILMSLVLNEIRGNSDNHIFFVTYLPTNLFMNLKFILIFYHKWKKKSSYTKTLHNQTFVCCRQVQAVIFKCLSRTFNTIFFNANILGLKLMLLDRILMIVWFFATKKCINIFF